MSKYNEYKAKAEILDKIIATLNSTTVITDTINLPLNKDGNEQSITLHPRTGEFKVNNHWYY
jgi:hypothetical protein